MSPRVTIHEILKAEGAAILLSDEDLNLVYYWSGRHTFIVYQEGPQGSLHEVDAWTTDALPSSYEEAKARCVERRDLRRREHAEA
jgi:hypothetical protein